jgi:hypothetical protein
MQYSSQYPLDPLTLEIYAGADRSMTLYEDDGESNAYHNGYYTQTEFEISQSGGEFVCHLGQSTGSFQSRLAERTMILNIHQLHQVSAVTCDGDAVPRLADGAVPGSAHAGWSCDRARRILSIKLPPANTARTIRVV